MRAPAQEQLEAVAVAFRTYRHTSIKGPERGR